MTRQDEHHKQRVVSGRIKVHPDGYGFVVPDDRSEDIHIAARQRGAAMDSDRVTVEWWVGARGLEGRVLSVVERGRGKITGQIVGTDILPFDDAVVAREVLGSPGGSSGDSGGCA